jgi:hypothetical protein
MSRIFKALQDEWYEKLKNAGFNDIERSFEFHSKIFQQKIERHNVMVKENSDYYVKAVEFFYIYDFENLRDKQIWLLHANGDSIRKIGSVIKLEKSQVHRLISKYKKIMLEAY